MNGGPNSFSRPTFGSSQPVRPTPPEDSTIMRSDLLAAERARAADQARAEQARAAALAQAAEQAHAAEQARAAERARLQRAARATPPPASATSAPAAPASATSAPHPYAAPPGSGVPASSNANQPNGNGPNGNRPGPNRDRQWAAAGQEPPKQADLRSLLDDYPEEGPGSPGSADTRPARTPTKRHRVRTSDGAELVVPMPGHRLSDARSSARLGRGLAIGALVLGLLLTAGAGGFAAVLLTRTPGAGAGTAAPATDTFNFQAASTYASRYLTWCLNRYADQTQDESRLRAADAMSTVQDQACRDSAGDQAEARSVSRVEFNGQSAEVPGMSGARYLSFAVDTTSGPLAYEVPVSLDDPIAGTGPRIAGYLGVLPGVPRGAPSVDDPDAEPPATDAETARQLQESFLPGFFEAWMRSDGIDQYVTADATDRARTGLAQAMSSPEITKVTVLPPEGATRNGSTFDYPENVPVEIQVQLRATSRGPDGRPRDPANAAYRVIAKQAGGKWLVHDVRGGLAEVPSHPAPSPS